ncbi:MAG: hypothetical protein KC477_03355 [Oceanospirillaceae bacterium]|nr:hypothetical protein [Oceanospirillaceae bacterium]
MQSMKQGVLLRQFFVWILLANLLSIGFMTVVGKHALDRSARETVGDSQVDRLASLARVLARHYVYADSWQPVIDNRRLWRTLASPLALLPNPDGSLPDDRDMRRNHSYLHPMLTSESYGGRPSLIERDRVVDPSPDAVRQNILPPPRRRLPSLDELAGSLLLYDTEGNLLRGNPKHERITSVEVPIRVRGEIVGVLKRPRPLREIQKIKFSVWNSATETLAWGIFITVMFSLMFAYIVSKNLTRPLIQISSALRKLASGDFTARVPALKNMAYKPVSDDVNFLGHALGESKETRQRWISDISHELRTPVSILNAEIESAEAGIQGSSEDMLESMREEITQLNTLINDLKTLSHSDLGGLNFERKEINVSRWLHQYAGKVQNAAEKHNLQLESACSEFSQNVTLFADENRLRQVFDNLLQNSLRYTDAGGKIRLSVRNIDRSLSIVWEDSEPAVPQASLPKLFDRLYRVEQSRSRATGGSGLGLSICKSIIDAQEGTIVARHSDLGGLAIEIRLPLDQVK